MSTPEERQRARDRAADGVAGHHEVMVSREGRSAFGKFKAGRDDVEARRVQQRIRRAAKRAATARAG